MLDYYLLFNHIPFSISFSFFSYYCWKNHTDDNTSTVKPDIGASLTSEHPRQRDGQTDRKRESGKVHLRTNGELGQSAAQPLRDCLQLFQLRLLTPALLAQDLVLQPLVTLLKTQHTCSKTQPCSHRSVCVTGACF